MSDLVQGKATICVVNYKTLDLTRVCLRSIRKYTDYPHEVLVIDNDSRDPSLDYLRGLSWIRLVERRSDVPDPSGSWAHAAALDLGLGLCQTEFFVAMHSDAVVLRSGWLTHLIGCFGTNGTVASVGGDKIEMKPRWQILLKKATDVRALQRRLFADPALRTRYRPFIRTICGLYRTEILRREGLSFQVDTHRRLTVGQKLYHDLRERGYKTVEVPNQVMRQYLIHLAHATQMLNPAEFGFGGMAKKWHQVMGRWFASESLQTLLQDNRLDR